MNEPTKTLPRFASEAEERAFWDCQDSTAYVDWSQAKRAVLSHLKPTTKTIVLQRRPT